MKFSVVLGALCASTALAAPIDSQVESPNAGRPLPIPRPRVPAIKATGSEPDEPMNPASCCKMLQPDSRPAPGSATPDESVESDANKAPQAQDAADSRPALQFTFQDLQNAAKSLKKAPENNEKKDAADKLANGDVTDRLWGQLMGQKGIDRAIAKQAELSDDDEDGEEWV